MENATDALIMAGSILLLIIALTVTISSLSNLRTQTQDLLDDRDQLLATTDESGYINYLKSGGKDSDVRIVGIETIISSIRRMWKEDYAIYIETDDYSGIPNDLQAQVNNEKNVEKNYIKLTLSGVGNKYINDNTLTGTIYSKFKDKKFKESIGIYQNKTAEGVSDANKETYKIVTYEQTNE